MMIGMLLIHVRRGAARPSSPLPPDGTNYIQSGVGDGGGSNTKAQRSLGRPASILARNCNATCQRQRGCIWQAHASRAYEASRSFTRAPSLPGLSRALRTGLRLHPHPGYRPKVGWAHDQKTCLTQNRPLDFHFVLKPREPTAQLSESNLLSVQNSRESRWR